jgi:hypothetical protein
VRTPEYELTIRHPPSADEDEKALQAKHEADKAPSVVFPDPRLQSKKARKKALEGVGPFLAPL